MSVAEACKYFAQPFLAVSDFREPVRVYLSMLYDYMKKPCFLYVKSQCVGRERLIAASLYDRDVSVLLENGVFDL